MNTSIIWVTILLVFTVISCEEPPPSPLSPPSKQNQEKARKCQVGTSLVADATEILWSELPAEVYFDAVETQILGQITLKTSSNSFKTIYSLDSDKNMLIKICNINSGNRTANDIIITEVFTLGPFFNTEEQIATEFQIKKFNIRPIKNSTSPILSLGLTKNNASLGFKNLTVKDFFTYQQAGFFDDDQSTAHIYKVDDDVYQYLTIKTVEQRDQTVHLEVLTTFAKRVIKK